MDEGPSGEPDARRWVVIVVTLFVIVNVISLEMTLFD